MNADQENRANLLSITPLIWRNEATGRVMFGGEAMTPDRFERRMCFDEDDSEFSANSEQDQDDPSRVKVWPDTWDGVMSARWYRGEEA